ncbi:MAG: hemolysin [Gemmatimonadetes bacterium]|nr:hemolysin [Gemmatimonadota bacterium]
MHLPCCPRSRRRAETRLVPVLLALACACSDAARSTAPNVPPTPPVTVPVPEKPPIEAENAAPGSREWFSERLAPQGDLSVWASPYAPHAGDTLDVYVHAMRGPVRVQLYRLGYYGGAGGRMEWERGGVPAAPQPACTPAVPGPVECPWQVTVRVPLGAGWTSGIYLVKVTDAAGMAAAYPLVVEDDRRTRFTVVVPQLTWQAYNSFGGASLYTYPGGGYGHHVSFERPYGRTGGAMFAYTRGVSNEVEAVHWLEKEGWDVTYVSDARLSGAARPEIDPSKGVIFAGHDEYWTMAGFDRVQRLRDAGKHLAFLSGNNLYWNVRLSPGRVTGRADQVISCFKYDPDPDAASPEVATRRFRSLGKPENAVYGIMFDRVAEADGRPLYVADSTAGPEARQFLAAAGLQPGDSIPDTLAGEGDEIMGNGRTPANLQVLFKSPFLPRGGTGPAGFYYTTFFIAPSGAGVFASGSNEYARALDDWFGSPADARLQRLTHAVLQWMQDH